jgi:siroheme synthase-like protein
MENVKNVTADQNRLYPVFLKLEQLNVLLVGGGNVGLEKLQSLLANSPMANIQIVAPQIKDEIRKLVHLYPGCSLIQREFKEEDLANRDLVLLATDNEELHQHIKKLTAIRRILTNVADTPGLCDFYLGSIVQKGNLKIAVSTNGKSPTIAKRLKEIIERLIPDEMEGLLNNLERIRKDMKGDFSEKVKQLNELTKILVS